MLVPSEKEPKKIKQQPKDGFRPILFKAFFRAPILFLKAEGHLKAP